MLGIILFCATIEVNRYYNFIQLRNKLRINQTPLSVNFDRREWFNFFIERATRDNKNFKRMMEFLFWNTPFEEIDKESMKIGLYTIATGSEIHDIHDKFFLSITDKIVELTNESYVKRETLLPFIRINNLTTNHVPSNPLFQIYPIHLCFQLARLYGDISLYNWKRDEKDNGLVFYRKCMNTYTNKKLLFFHGLGLGVVPYLNFVTQIGKEYNEIIIVEFPGISRNIYTYYPTAQEIVETIINEFDTNDIVDAVGHSYGSIVLSYIANKAPRFLNKRVYLDTPVFFPDTVKFWPQVFKPITWSYILKLVGNRKLAKAFGEFIFAEQWNQHLMHNATYFYEYCNLEYNLDDKTLIILGAKDHLINAYNIQRYIEEYYPTVDIRVYNNGRHGDAIKCAGEIMKFLKQ